MKNYHAPADGVQLTAPYAVTPGDGMLVGSLFAVASKTAASGVLTDAVTEGMFYLPTVSAETAPEGSTAFWDAANRRVSVSTGVAIGHFSYAKLAGETSTRVRLQASALAVQTSALVSGGGISVASEPGPRATSLAYLMADADRALSTRGRPLTRWANSTVANGALVAPLSEPAMFDTSLSYCAKLVGKTGVGSRPTVTAQIFGAAAASSNFFGVMVQVKTPYRAGLSFVPLRVRLQSGASTADCALSSFAAPADGKEHWICLGSGNFSAIGTFVIGTSSITHVTVEDRNDPPNIGYDGLLPGEFAYVGQVYLNPKGRAKAIIRFDDSLRDIDTATATFSGDGVTQAWSCAALVERYGFRASTFNLSKRFGTTNSVTSFITLERLKVLYDKGWDHCVQAHADPVDAVNSGAKLLGPTGYALKAIASVDTSADTITAAANHNISAAGSYWGYPITFAGTDLPAPLQAGVEYWARNVSASAFSLHPTENDSIAGTAKIDLTTAGVAANFSYRYSGSSNDSKSIQADYETCRNILINAGMPRGANIVAMNQGAFDPYVVQAIVDGGFDLAWGILGGSAGTLPFGRCAIGETGSSGNALTVGGAWLTLPSAVQTDGSGSPNAAAIRAYVQSNVAAGTIFGNYHHGLSAANGVQLDAFLDELRIQQAAGALDICTPSEVAEYLALFRPINTPFSATAI